MLITDTLSPQAFEEALRAKGAFYHIHHPYHIAMHNGEATREQIQGWVAKPVLLPDHHSAERRGDYG
ncbi:coenzyme PQQ synthesis protein C [Klebsiella variicola]|nr:coenzyme PQQ synthesis protein C [Klebsiella variicola]